MELTNRIRKNKKVKRDHGAYLYLSPWFIGFILFTGGPLIMSFLLSLTKWNLLGEPTFVGLDNYRTLFSGDSALYNTLKVTLLFTLVNVLITVTVSLFLAVLLNFEVRIIGLFQILYFLPAVVPSVVMASVFNLMFNKELGVINYLLSFLNIAGPNWLNDSSWVWVTVAIASVFTYSTGQMMLVFSSSLKEVPTELYEAADIDGATFWQKFINVTLPSISPILLFNTVVATVNSFNSSFNLIYPLTGGGPGNATKVLSLSIYENAFHLFDMGIASTMSVILFIIVAIITALQFKLSKDNVTY